jgi:toxin ParE2
MTKASYHLVTLPPCLPNTVEMRVEYAAQAVAEVDEALAYYRAIDPTLSTRLVGEIEEALRLVEAMPLGWKPINDDLRQRRLKVFPYVFIYAVRTDVIGIVAFAHTHRRPQYWRDRLIKP